jgi:hypothetical protein
LGEAGYGFKLDWTMVNAEPMSEWEYHLMYGPEGRAGRGGEPPTNDLAYQVCFPTRELVLKVKLPEKTKWNPYVDIFWNDLGVVKPHVDEAGVLTRGPLAGNWYRDPDLTNYEKSRLEYLGDKTWRLEVRYPPMGSMYTITWPLGGVKEGRIPRHIGAESDAFRDLLLRYREARLGHDPGIAPQQAAMEGVLRNLYSVISSKFASIDTTERIDVTLMTYDSNRRRMVIIDGLVNGEELPQPYWDLYLPPGLGNGGACLKSGKGIFYLRDDRNEFSHYVRVLNGYEHAVLISLPLDHPELEEQKGVNLDEEPPKASRDDFDLERRSQLVGVMNVGSTSPASLLARLEFNSAQFSKIHELCQFHLNQLWPVFARSLPDLQETDHDV